MKFKIQPPAFRKVSIEIENEAELGLFLAIFLEAEKFFSTVDTYNSASDSIKINEYNIFIRHFFNGLKECYPEVAQMVER